MSKIEMEKTGFGIKVMPEELANQIAAGEVVERPASVAKELIENGLDAGADSIEIDVSLQRRRIRVKDNGCGIAPDELELAVSRHGTSKVYRLDDIFGISTFGFRGEALPSIGSVSRLTVTSSRPGSGIGKRIEVEGGKIISLEDAPPINGTEVLVENLFFNTPARRKFARSDNTEMTHIASSVAQCALSNPGVRITFVKEKKRVLELPPAGSVSERVRQIFGSDYSDRLLEVSYDQGGLKITGLAGKPDFNRATSIDQYFFVNGRPVKDALIRTSVARAFFDMMPKGRKPVIFLNIEIPFDLVDVNVHPAKAEVRFSDPGSVSSAIVNGIRSSIGRSAAPAFAQERGQFNPSANNNAGGFGYPSAGYGAETKPPERFERSFELWSAPFRNAESAEQAPAQPELAPVHGRLSPSAVPIGQAFETFILVEEGDLLIALDQHTVHERILFERIMNRIKDNALERQKLLVTQSFSTNQARAALIRSYRKTFSDLGWEIEDYGEDAFIIREVPAILVGKNYAAIILEMSETIEGNRNADFREMTSGLVARMACRGAVKAGDRLSLKEIGPMIEELGKTELPYTCPHGRPIALEIAKSSLLKGFSRGK